MKYNRNVYQALTMIMQFGINMLVPIFLCSFAGMYLDRIFGTSFWMILLFFVGTLAGFTNVFRFARKIYETPAVTRRRSTMTVDKDSQEQVNGEQMRDGQDRIKVEQMQDNRDRIEVERMQDNRDRIGFGRMQDSREQVKAGQIRDEQQQVSGERDVQKRGGI